MKKSSLIIFSLFILLLSGCSSENNTVSDSSSNSEVESSTEVDNSGNELYKVSCSRDVEQEGIEADLSVVVYHDGIDLIILEQTDIISGDTDIVDSYEDAYIDINKTYEGIEYYDTSVERDGDTVTRTSRIDYSKVNTSKIIDIEGMEDNIFNENGEVKYNDWLTFFKKYGGTCEE